MQLHNTKGIVLKTIKYGETSIVVSVLTELFGLQSYIVKGARQVNKKGYNKATYFQNGAMLDMTVYNNEQKNMQFIKEFNWGFIYQSLFTDVVKNCVAVYIIEVLQNTLKQPESNADLFYFVEDTLKKLDAGGETLTANLSIFFMLHLGAYLGFKIQGEYTDETPFLDLSEGFFVETSPEHPYFISDELAKAISIINNINDMAELENIKMNKNARRLLLQYLFQYLSLHISDFGILKTLPILQEIIA